MWVQGTCQFKCAACGKRTNTSIRFWNHVMTVHDLNSDTYRAKFWEKDHYIIRNSITCQGGTTFIFYNMILLYRKVQTF
jgi:hypothetical protein